MDALLPPELLTQWLQTGAQGLALLKAWGCFERGDAGG